MPDGRAVPDPSPTNHPVAVAPRTFVGMLEEGLASLASGDTVGAEELERAIDAAFAEQDALRATNRL